MAIHVSNSSIDGVLEIRSSAFTDARGVFLNVFRSAEPSFLNFWGDRHIHQVNISVTRIVGTIRGLHLQSKPHHEAKIVRCLRGRVWDVAVDLRRNSPTYGKWTAIELSPDLNNAIMIPEGCAHGFQVLEPSSELLYLHSGNWNPKAETGVRWDDPHLAVAWPLPALELSARDRDLPFLANLPSNI